MMFGALMLTSCASFFMVGAKPYSGVPSNVVARYHASNCTWLVNALLNASVVAGPANQTYYLANGEAGPVLYELDQNNKGAAITNHWRDAKGDHFLAYVKKSGGWEYVIPADRSQEAERLVYIVGTFLVDNLDGVLKVTGGGPKLRCPMVSSQAKSPATPPPPAPSQPASTNGCTKDGDCRGDRVCINGQCLTQEVAKPLENKLLPPNTAASGPAATSNPTPRVDNPDGVLKVTGGGPKPRGPMVGSQAGSASTPPPPAPSQPASTNGCAKDTDCKGDRVCFNGQCLSQEVAKSLEKKLYAPDTAASGPATTSNPTQPGAIPSVAPTGMKFMPEHLAELREAGYLFDEKDTAIADHMALRGFSPAEFIAAYRATKAIRLAAMSAEAYPREMVEAVAIGQRLRLGEKDLMLLVRERFGNNRTLTEAYNDGIVGGVKTTIAGAGFMVLAVASLLVADGSHSACNPWGGAAVNCTIETISYISAAVLAVPGIALSSVGMYRYFRRVPSGSLDGDSVVTAAAGQERTPKLQLLAVSPIVTRNAGGVAAVFAF